jgi:hypothetical protein
MADTKSLHDEVAFYVFYNYNDSRKIDHIDPRDMVIFESTSACLSSLPYLSVSRRRWELDSFALQCAPSRDGPLPPSVTRFMPSGTNDWVGSGAADVASSSATATPQSGLMSDVGHVHRAMHANASRPSA